jgi:hypothetical protein
MAVAMDVVDYEIKGSEMQFVEVELDPGEAAVGEAGSMMFMDAGIGMDTVFGDGSASCWVPASGSSPANRSSRPSTPTKVRPSCAWASPRRTLARSCRWI